MGERRSAHEELPRVMREQHEIREKMREVKGEQPSAHEEFH
jgi:hypothetical protein